MLLGRAYAAREQEMEILVSPDEKRVAGNNSCRTLEDLVPEIGETNLEGLLTHAEGSC